MIINIVLSLCLRVQTIIGMIHNPGMCSYWVHFGGNVERNLPPCSIHSNMERVPHGVVVHCSPLAICKLCAAHDPLYAVGIVPASSDAKIKHVGSAAFGTAHYAAHDFDARLYATSGPLCSLLHSFHAKDYTQFCM